MRVSSKPWLSFWRNWTIFCTRRSKQSTRWTMRSLTAAWSKWTTWTRGPWRDRWSSRKTCKILKSACSSIWTNRSRIRSPSRPLVLARIIIRQNLRLMTGKSMNRTRECTKACEFRRRMKVMSRSNPSGSRLRWRGSQSGRSRAAAIEARARSLTKLSAKKAQRIRKAN